MYVQCVENLEDLLPYRERWEELAGDCVFRGWSWLTTWWQHYGVAPKTSGWASISYGLHVLLVFDDDLPTNCREKKNASCSASADKNTCPADRLIAILPCYLDISLARGRVLRLLGDGEVCSDHLDLLVAPADTQRVVEQLADALCHHEITWERADFSAIDADALALHRLFAELKARDCQISQEVQQSSWSIELPKSWDEFLAQQSKSLRKQLRRLERRVLDAKHAVWHLVESPEQFAVAWDIFVDLHQRRRRSLGEPGCFASEQFAGFHRDVAQQLLAVGRLRLSWLEMDGQPVASEYNFAGNEVIFAYQGGLDPDRLDEEPGRLSMICTVGHAIAGQCREFDLLRGDEPYKAHWRATPHETYNIQVVPPHGGARWRWRAWTYLRGAKRWARQFANMLS